MSKIAIIPARSGSKGLKDKNIKDLCGKPLLAYTIEAAIESNIFDCIHVSTDSEKYAHIAKRYGAEVPFLRDKEYATDLTSTWDTVRHVLQKYQEIGRCFDIVVVLQPTSPFRTAEDICNAYGLFKEKNALSVVSVCQVKDSPLLCNYIGEDLSLNNFIDINLTKRRQDMPIYYKINGAIYMLKKSILDDINGLYGANSYAYIMEADASIDIDTEFDFDVAEIKMTKEGY